MLNVNVAATAMVGHTPDTCASSAHALFQMTHMLLPGMLEKRKGAIINVCSNVACTPPIPLQSGVTAAMVMMFHRV